VRENEAGGALIREQLARVLKLRIRTYPVGVAVNAAGDVVVASNLEVLGVGEDVLLDVHEEVEDLLLLVQEVEVRGLGVISAGRTDGCHRGYGQQGENDAVAHHLRRLCAWRTR
jgi:hypothetical protein